LNTNKKIKLVMPLTGSACNNTRNHRKTLREILERR